MKQCVSWVLSAIYFFNITTFAYFGSLLMSAPLHAQRYGASQPMELECPRGAELLAGRCLKETRRAILQRCESGFSIYGGASTHSPAPSYAQNQPICFRNETKRALLKCPTNFGQGTLFPNQCYRRLACTDSAVNRRLNGGCYRVVNSSGRTCPADAAMAAPRRETLDCRGPAMEAGACQQGVEITTPDERWRLSGTQCHRTLWGGVEYSCPTGFAQEATDCVKYDNTAANRRCPAGSYGSGHRCIAGEKPTCPAGATLTPQGYCQHTNGERTCPSGKVRQNNSNFCVNASEDDPDPSTWDRNDFDRYYADGTQVGGLIAAGVQTPTIGSDGSVNSNAVMPEAMTSAEKALFKALPLSGVDANNDYSSTEGTYQNEQKQHEVVVDALQRNHDYLASGNASGATPDEVVDNTDHTAVAYGTVQDIQNQNPPGKISRDAAIFQNSRAAVAEASQGKGRFFNDCTQETVTSLELDPSLVTTRAHRCVKPNRNNLSGCEISRVISPPTLNILEGAGNAAVNICGTHCVQLILGKIGDNYLTQKGACGIYEKKVKIRVKDGFAIETATLHRRKYDDHFRVMADNQIIFNGVHSNFNTPDGFPDGTQNCERKTSREINTPVDVTSQFNQALSGDNTIEFSYRIAVGGLGEAYALVDLQFDKPIATTWSEEVKELPKGCLEAIELPQDTFCTNTPNEWVCNVHRDFDEEVINLSKVNRGGEGFGAPGSHGDGIVMVLRRDFDISAAQCGLVVATQYTNGHEDDGIYFCGNKAGIGTHTESSRSIRGTQLSNLLPIKNQWEVVGAVLHKHHMDWYRLEGDTARKFRRVAWGGDFDDLKMSGFRLNRARFSLDWSGRASGDLWLADWKAVNNPSDEDMRLAMQAITQDNDFLNFKPLFPGDPNVPICMQAHATNYVCDPLKGRKVGTAGGEVTFHELLNLSDGCDTYDNDAQCSVMGQSCMDAWFDEATNTCYAWDVNYICEDTSRAMVERTRVNNACLSNMDCVDGTCDVRGDEQNEDFVEALSTYAAMNEMGESKNCTEPGNPESCQVFSGQPRYCGWDQLRVNDCCEQPEGVSVLEVFTLGWSLYKNSGYAASAGSAFAGQIDTAGQAAGKAINGAWNSLKEPVVNATKSAWNAVSTKLTGAAGNAAGNATTQVVTKTGASAGKLGLTGAKEALKAFKEELMNKIYDLLPDALQNAVKSAAKAGAGTTGGAALNELATKTFNFLGAIAFWYSMYQLAELAYTLLTQCNDDEMDMGVELMGKKCFFTSHKKCKKVLGVCTNRAKNYYCCYNAVLSRIIMEQATTQLGWNHQAYRDDMGCRGLTIPELGLVDFSQIKFDEWVNMMAQSNQIPRNATMDSVTGDHLANAYGRENAEERQQSRAGNNEWADRRREIEAGDVLINTRCNVHPRPPSCDVKNPND